MKLLFVKIITLFTSRLRYLPILLVLQKGRHIPVVRRATRFFDPNYIRKVRAFHCRPKFAHLTWRGTRLLVDVNDHIGFQSFVRHEPFEMTVYRMAKKIGLTSSDVILDIGANIGTASIPICRELGCELAAIEASKETAAQLLKNIALNNVKAHVDVIALSSDPGKGGFLKLHLSDGNRGANSLLDDWSTSIGEQRYELTPCKTLDQYIRTAPYSDRLGLIKIDVEGAELDVLRSGRDFLSRNTAPVLMEYRIDASPKTREMLHQVLDEMHPHYTVHALDKDASKLGFDRETPYENILFIRRTQPYPA